MLTRGGVFFNYSVLPLTTFSSLYFTMKRATIQRTLSAYTTFFSQTP